ncbi:MAG: GNAT family N-acetyltransferase [Spirosomataceae bacterium]
MNITNRIATEQDVESILAIYLNSNLDKKILNIEAAQSIFKKIAQYPDYKIYIVEADSKPIGTFALLIMDNLGHLGTPSAVVEDVAVIAEYQGKGIGKKMMEFAMQIAKEKGCYKLTLSSNLRREAAHAFYESLGFTKHGYSFLIEF